VIWSLRSNAERFFRIGRNVVNGTISLTQKGLIKRIMEALEVGGLLKTPASADPLTKDEEGEEPSGMFNYASVIGMLQYLQNHSRPYITFAGSQCARFIHQPRRSHELALIRIRQYLRGTSENGIVFKPSGKLKVDYFVDADFAGLWPHEDHDDPVCVKSRSGYVICLSDCPVVWGSKLQVRSLQVQWKWSTMC
jgi:hypothetical protein